jgi:metal iron transporter
VVQSGALYVSVGILGATVMPHAIILGSHFASIDRLPSLDGQDDAVFSQQLDEDDQADIQDQSRWRLITGSFSRLMRPKPETKTELLRLTRVFNSLIHHRTGTHDVESDSSSHSGRGRTATHRYPTDDLPPRTLENIRIHIKHASIDIGMSLVSFAIVINSAILIVAAAAFYYTPNGNDGSGSVVVASLYDAFYLLKDRLGSLAAVLFAVALLAAGQSASITVTLAGQLVSEGFINWRTDPFLRRVVTRLVAIIPSLTVSLAVGKDGLDEMLVASQVALSIALPFVLLPLILVTGNKARMTATVKDEAEVGEGSLASSTRTSGEEQMGRRSDEQADDGAGKVRPGITKDVGTSASLAVIGMLPREGALSPGEGQRASPSLPAADSSSSAALQPHQPSPSAGATLTREQQASSNSNKSPTFASAWYVQVVAYAIFAVIVVADVYVLITTFMGVD